MTKCLLKNNLSAKNNEKTSQLFVYMSNHKKSVFNYRRHVRKQINFAQLYLAGTCSQIFYH